MGEQVLPGAELALRGDIVGLGKAGPSGVVGLGDGHEAYLVGMRQGVRSIGVVAPIASAHQHSFYRLSHGSAPLAGQPSPSPLPCSLPQSWGRAGVGAVG
ncbi:MAG: hypothetical protein FJ014_09675 [Chloroflexi bacterium]|nr:hypothetical protein [Chloroflexota bacterium]